MSSSLLRTLVCRRATWHLLRRQGAACGRPQRIHASAAAAAATSTPSAPPFVPSQVPQVEPPPIAPYSSEAVNSVALTGTVLSDPQVHYFPTNQVTAHVRLGLRPRAGRPNLPQQPQGAVTVDAWGLLALQLAQHVRKGSRIQVRGVLKEDSWADKTTGQARFMVKVVAEELALLAPADQHQEQQQQEEWVPPPMQHRYEPPAQQPLPPQQQEPAPMLRPARPPPPRFSGSARVTRHMYEVEGAELDAIAATRGIKLSTAISHLLAAASAGEFSSWQRLASDVRLGPPGSPAWLSPAEVAEAVAAVQQDNPGMELPKLPLKLIRKWLAESRHTAGKVAELEASRGGDPELLYGQIKLVMEMLEQGVSFAAISSAPQPAGAAASQPDRSPF